MRFGCILYRYIDKYSQIRNSLYEYIYVRLREKTATKKKLRKKMVHIDR